MAEENGAQAAAEPKQPRMQVLGQFIKDLSFENIAAQNALEGDHAPDVKVSVSLDANQRSTANQFNVVVKLNIDAKGKESGSQLFLMELEYAGVFLIENVPPEQMHPFLLIECPRMLFPFLRRVVHDLTRDGGYPPLNLENIDFLGLYRAEAARQQAAAAAKPN